MVKRDEHGIICQHDIFDGNYMDGGDSSRATGMMAMTESISDEMLVFEFELLKTGLLRRHPTQAIFNDPNNFTRDQLVQFMTGVNKTIVNGKNKEVEHGNVSKLAREMARRVFWSHAKRLFFCQNTHDIHGNKKPWYKGRDPLPPSNIGQLIIVAKLYPLYPFLLLSGLWMLLEIHFESIINDIDRENNQIIALCDVYGKWFLKLYCFLDKNWEKRLMKYWGVNDSSFRYQPEIGERIINYIKNRIK